MILKTLLIGGLTWLAHDPGQKPHGFVQFNAMPGYRPLMLQNQQTPAEAYAFVVGQQQPSFTFAPDADVPSVWIGVRMVPVPDALAAHIDHEGIMISNVVEGSPADKAGVERYDVVVSFDGESIENGEQLVEVINEIGAGKKANLVVIRGGAQQTLKLRPGKRPNNPDHAYKYDEPALAQNNINYFGHNMKLTPNGQWQMQPLGQMHDLSDLFKDLDVDLDNMQSFTFNGNGQMGLSPMIKMHKFPGMQFDVEFDFDSLMEDLDIDGADGDVEIVIRSSDGANTMEIQRNPDGTFTVTRDGEDGEQTDEYENAEQLEEEDAEAFEMFEGHSIYKLGGGRSMIFLEPRDGDLSKMQKDFSTQIEERIREAHGKAADARVRVGKRMRHSDDGQSKRTKRRVMRKRTGDNDQQENREVKMQVKVNDDGVRVELTEDGVHKIYEFESIDHFRRSEPELFERCGPMMEEK